MKPFQLFLCVVMAVGLAGCDRLDPHSAEAKRQKIFQDILHNSEDISGMMRGRQAFDEQRLRTDVMNLQALADKPWPYFADANSPLMKRSRAKPEIWTDAAGYRKAIEQFQEAVGRLAEKTRQTPLTKAAVEDDVTALEHTCTGCHKGYRNL